MSALIKKLLLNKTYCALPFVHQHLNLNGKNFLCCYSAYDRENHVNEQQIKQIQQDIVQGKSADQCKICYNWEKSGIISPRLKETMSLIKSPYIVDILEKSIVDIEMAKTVSHDIRFDNRCNLACIGCNSQDSSLWARLDHNRLKTTVHAEDSVDISNSKKIYLAGGEPLINDKVYRLLEKVVTMHPQPEVVINSNIASIKPKFFAILEKLNNVSIVVSVDGAESVGEYHRWPMQWSKFLRNLQTINNMGIHVSWNTVVDAVSVWGLEKLIEFEHLTKGWNLTLLQNPLSLQLKNLPIELKDMAQQQLNSLKQSKFYSSDPVVKSHVDTALIKLLEPGNPQELADRINFIDQQRKLNHETFLGVKLT